MREFVYGVIQLVIQGMHIKAIETFIAERRLHFCQSKHICLQNELQLRFNVIDIECEPLMLLRQPIPSNDVMTKCFLVYFQQSRLGYEKHMASLTALKLISLDHTFKIASNIGYVRNDGCWVTQYTSVFFVLNEVGQVLTWQLTNTTSIDEVKAVLESLAVRLKKQGVVLPLVMVDNCCNSRNKIKGIFGEHVCVCLDLFHAIQRISRKLPKFHHLCMKDLRLLLRDPRDIGSDRKLYTNTSIYATDEEH